MPYFGGGTSFTGGTLTSPLLVPDGSVAAPFEARSAASGTGMYFSAANQLSLVSANNIIHSFLLQEGTSYTLSSGAQIGWTNTTNNSTATVDTKMARGGTTGAVRIFGGTVPTISSGFGTSPSVTAGGSNSLFQVNVGGGGTATSGVVAFNGTWTNAPFCVVTDTTTTSGVATKVTAVNQTTVTLGTVTAWPANALINCLCFSV